MWTEIKMKKVAGILVIGAALALGMVQSGHAEWTWRDSAIMGEVEAKMRLEEAWRLAPSCQPDPGPNGGAIAIAALVLLNVLNRKKRKRCQRGCKEGANVIDLRNENT